ncbi:MAG TPA: hypothetical protein VGH28_13705 [Polyangiaceae bacterium]
MTVLIRRAGEPSRFGDSFHNSGGPLTWRPIIGPTPEQDPKGHWQKMFGDDLALVTCANGHELRLSGRVHRVAPDGTVTPSDVCTVPGCTFHEFIRLEGWPGR